MIWWMSSVNTELKAIKKAREDDREALEELRDQVTANAITKANFTSALTTMSERISHVREFVDSAHAATGRNIQLQLDNQSKDLKIALNDMWAKTKRELAEETAEATAYQIQQALKGRQ